MKTQRLLTWMSILIWLLIMSLHQTRTAVAADLRMQGQADVMVPTQFNCATVIEIPQNECESLVTLYTRTDGPNWTNKSGWLSNASACSWYGVTCEGGRVSNLNLSQNQLMGTIPPELGNLTNLRGLYLQSNQLTGNIPPELGYLTDLRYLYLLFNQLTGEIPSELGRLSNLEWLYLSWNNLDGSIPPQLGNLNKLVLLALDSNDLVGTIPSELANLSSLWGLLLSSNQLSGNIPVELSQLSNLTNLQLDSNQLTGAIPVDLTRIKTLIYLFLSNNQLTGSIPPELGSLTNLKGLRLSLNNLSGTIPLELGNLSNLEELSLYSNELTGVIPPQLGNLSSLTTLTLHSNQLSGSIPPALGMLSNLANLSLASNHLMGNIPPELGSLSQLRGLDLSSNLLSGLIPIELANLSQLRSLRLYRNHLNGSIPVQLANLEGLTYLHLAANQLSGNIPAELGTLANLEWLFLGNNQLTGTTPSELGNLNNLMGLFLGDNQLTGAIPEELGRLTKLSQLDLSSNQLRGHIPNQLSNLTGLTYLSLEHNLLTASSSLLPFLSEKNPDWFRTQTLSPTDIQISPLSSEQLEISWLPIAYIEDGGYYEISYGTRAGGPFTTHGTTANKGVSSYTLDGLNPVTTYHVRVRTYTPAHDQNQNDLWSDYSQINFATTPPPALIPLPNEARLLLISDANALRSEFLDTGYMESQDFNENGQDDWFDLIVRLNQYLKAHQGGLLDLALEITIDNGYSANYADLNYGVHEHRLLMGELFDEMIYRKSVVEQLPIENIVILGDDQVVPFYRIFDPTDEYRVGGSKERDYPREVGDHQNNPALLDSGQGYILSDMPYAAKGRHSIENDSSLRSNLGIGRIFAATPDQLRQAIESFERPIVLNPESARASVFTHKDIERQINFPAAMLRSTWPIIEKWFLADQRNFFDGSTRASWGIETALDALAADDLVSIWSHTNHRQVQVVSDSYLGTLQFNHLFQLENSKAGRIFIGLGCNLGYSVANYPDGTPSEHYTRALINQFIAKGITTLAPSGYATLQLNLPVPNLNELLTSLFVKHLVHNEQVGTVGDLWQVVFPDFHKYDPYGLSGNPASNAYHLKATYGNVFYGLPTQPIVRQGAGLRELVMYREVSTVTPAQSRSASSMSLQVDVAVPEFIVEQFNNGSLFRIPGGGFQIAPNFGPALPVVARTLILPSTASHVQVTQMDGGKASIYPGTVNLPKTGIVTTNNEVVEGSFTIPAAYPEEIFWVHLSEQDEGLRLDLLVVPMQYNASNRQVTVYTNLSFRVDYLLNASVGAFFEKVEVAHPSLPRGVTTTVSASLVSPNRMQLMLWWRAQGADGLPIAVKQSPVTVAGGIEIDFTIDTEDWPAGSYDLTVGLSDENGILDTENIALVLTGTRLQLAADTADQLPIGAGEVTLRLYAYDQSGNPLTVQANNVHVSVDGASVTARIREVRTGTYEVVLETANWSPGSHIIRLGTQDNSARSIEISLNVAAVNYPIFLPTILK